MALRPLRSTKPCYITNWPSSQYTKSPTDSVNEAIDDTELRRVVDDLSKELPENLERYVTKEGELPSRKQQLAEAERFRSVGRHDPYRGPSDGPFPQDSLSGPSAPRGGGGGGGGAGGAAKGTNSRSTGNSGGANRVVRTGGNDGVTRSVSNSRHAGYSRKSFSAGGQSGSGRGVKIRTRSYSRGIRSARLARGIAIGGNLDIELTGKPASAYWFPNQKDRRFGRFFIKLDTGKIAVSRVLFTDSFMASVDLIQSRSGRESELHEGDLLILMSMSPEENWTAGGRIRERLRGVDTELERRAIMEKIGLMQLLKSMDAKGTVLHPALFGTELGWSSVRVDFSFGDINALTQEASQLESDREVPKKAQIKNINADTWQFFEFNHTIKSEPSRQEGVLSVWAQATSVPDSRNEKIAVPQQSHFGISMFSENEIEGAVAVDGEDGLYRLPKLEREVQPLLDWLSDKHHDFIRLNDFSEALSLVRWLGREDASLKIIDLNGREPAILTPDRITASGPKAGD